MSTAEQDPRLQVDAEGLAGLWTRFTRRVREGELGSLPVIIGLIIIWTVFAVSEENFLTAGNLTNLMLQIAGLGIIATGVVMVLLLGEIDLSVGIVSGLAASVMAVLSVKQDWPGWAAIVAALLVGLGAGLFQGFFVTFFRVPSFVVTLAGLLGFQGRAALRARRHRDDQPHRQPDPRPGQHVLLGLRRLDHRDRAAGAVRAADAERLPQTIGGRPRHRDRRSCSRCAWRW